MIKWGILGCGKIARKFASDLTLVPQAKLCAIASRNRENANAFAAEFGAEKIFYQYEELAECNDVDVIYIATPHALHYENTMLCLQHNKAVLCEKAFAMNASQAALMIAEAQSRNVFLMEAMWTKFLPNYNKLISLLREGFIGEVQSLLIDFGFRAEQPPSGRLLNPALGGGTLLDIGVYNVFMALSILGMPENIEAHASLSGQGTDEQCAVLFKYSNGVMAQLFSTFRSNTPTVCSIGGTKGRLHITHRFYTPFARIEYYPATPDTKQILYSGENEKGWGYHYQAAHVCECLEKGLTQSPVMRHADTLQLMNTLDAIRKIAGIRYEEDEGIAISY